MNKEIERLEKEIQSLEIKRASIKKSEYFWSYFNLISWLVCLVSLIINLMMKG